MASKRWTATEMFYLLQYPRLSAKELSKVINRTENAIKCKINNLNISDDYKNERSEEESINVFCSDCLYSHKTCGQNVKDCLNDEASKLYKRFYNVNLNEDLKDKKIVINKKQKVKNKRLII
jgi:hypothetical protein